MQSKYNHHKENSIPFFHFFLQVEWCHLNPIIKLLAFEKRANTSHSAQPTCLPWGYTTALQWLCLLELRGLHPPGHSPVRDLVHLLHRYQENA